MISAFGVEHGEIYKARVPLIPRYERVPNFEGRPGHVLHRKPSKLLKEKATYTDKGFDEDVPFKARVVQGGGLTRAGKITAGTAAAGGAGGTGVAVQQPEEEVMISAFGVEHGDFSKSLKRMASISRYGTVQGSK